MVSRTRCGRGFLLAEVLIAGTILGVAIAVVVGLTAAAVNAQTQGRSLRTAAHLADDRLQMVLATGVEGFSQVMRDSGSFDPPFERYSYRLDIDRGGPGDADTVRCAVFWMDGSRERSLVIETKIAPRLGDDPDPDRAPSGTVEREGG